jgi:hypothetical protein
MSGLCYWALGVGTMLGQGPQPVAVAGEHGGVVEVVGKRDPVTGAIRAELPMTIQPGYADALLLRASFGEADGVLRFDGRTGPVDSVFLPPESVPFPVDTGASAGRTWKVQVEATASACYTLQVDGWDFSQVIDVRIGSAE